ncbi:MAG: NAD-dependent deacylase [Cystobacterineae bacterium]|nr:NAD-dependent deacylase [Cystobacterineae bacterium]
MKALKKIVALTGAGISAESGIMTFRDSGGLWEKHEVREVASIEGWRKNPQLMLRFYNERRKQLEGVEPNAAHHILAELEKKFDLTVVTQNVDNLHERAGSSKILHLHGELTKARSSTNPEWVVDIGYRPIEWGEKAPDGSPLRPHIVWFGEAVPMMSQAAEAIALADMVLIIGTSLNVYPAAGLVEYAAPQAPIYLVDPNEISYPGREIITIREKATVGMEQLKKILTEC